MRNDARRPRVLQFGRVGESKSGHGEESGRLGIVRGEQTRSGSCKVWMYYSSLVASACWELAPGGCFLEYLTHGCNKIS